MKRPMWVRFLGLGVAMVGACLFGLTWATDPRDPVALQLVIASAMLVAAGWLLVGSYRFASRKERR